MLCKPGVQRVLVCGTEMGQCCVHVQLVGTGIRVTTIQPGDCATPLVTTNSDTEACAAMGVTPGKIVGEGWANGQHYLLKCHPLLRCIFGLLKSDVCLSRDDVRTLE